MVSRIIPASAVATRTDPDKRSWWHPARRPIRVALLVVLAFVATDFALRADLARHFASGAFRLPRDTNLFLREYITYLGEHSAPRIYVIGDSVIQGVRLAPGETVPARIGARLPAPWSAANLGLTASKIPDFFYMTGLLRAQPGDVAVYNINPKNFSAYDIARPLRFYDLYDASLDRVAGFDAADALAIPPDRRRPRAGGDAVSRTANDAWFFFRNRDWISAELLGTHPRKLIDSYHRVFVYSGVRGSIDRLLRRAGRTDWREKRWDPWAIDVLKKYYDVPPLDDANPVFRFIAPCARLARERGMTPVFFMTPMNRAFADEHALVDWARHADNIARIRAAIEANGGVFVDTTDTVAPGGFADNDHLNTAGADQLAAALAGTILPRLGDDGGAP